MRWNPEAYARDTGFVSDLGADLIALFDPKPGEEILDLGCGDGRLTERLAATGASVTGVDSSADQIAAAAARGLDAHVMDGHALTFEDAFDGVISNAALHWMTAPDKAIAGVARALRPGGRFIGEMGGSGNVAAVRAALRDAMDRRGLDYAGADPWYFPDAEEYGGKLRAAGFDVHDIEIFDRPTPMAAGFRAWVEVFGPRFIEQVAPGEREAFFDEIESRARPGLYRDGGWVIDYVRLRFVASLQA